jgi:hypothetical protein
MAGVSGRLSSAAPTYRESAALPAGIAIAPQFDDMLLMRTNDAP